jgi:LPS export ABC transporter protein LptC
MLTSKARPPSESATNIEILYSDSGKVKTKISAPIMNKYYDIDTPYLEMPNGIKVIFFNDSLRENSRLTANYAIRYDKKNMMEARSNVIVVNEKGEQLNTERLIWDENTEKISTPDFVKITTKDEIIMGKGLESNQTFTKYHILNVTGTFPLNKEK